jgi:hypothetical protein
MRLTLALLLSFPLLALAQPPATRSTEDMIEILRKNVSEPGLIGDLAKRSYDPRVIPALRDFFVQAKETGAMDVLGINPVAQQIALVLIKLGAKDEVYLNEVLGSARDAIAADPPLAFLTDARGKEDPEKRNPAFEEWCATRSLEWNQCARRMTGYIGAVGLLGDIRDKGAVDVLRQALKASNYLMVLSAVGGLATLNDTGSIPLIAQACARFPELQAGFIAVSATEFDDPGVQILFERFIKDPELREAAKKEWRAKHSKQQ